MVVIHKIGHDIYINVTLNSCQLFAALELSYYYSFIQIHYESSVLEWILGINQRQTNNQSPRNESQDCKK